MATETEKQLDEIINSFVNNNSNRDGYEVYKIPKPLNISILGHSGAGKTTLVESIIKYLSNEFDPNGILSAYVPAVTQQKYKRISEIIDVLCKTDSGFVTNLNLGRGTSSVQTFDFYLDFKISDKPKIKISLPVQIQDTPGGFHNSENLGSEDYDNCSPEYQKFIDHLEKSQMVIIPIDTIKMQSVDMTDEEMKGAYNNTIQLKAIIGNLKQHFAKDPSRNYSLHFALTKCETYFSQDETGRLHEKCFENFKLWYPEIVNEFYNREKVKIHYTPVETVGSFKLKETKCEITDTEPLGKFLHNTSLFEATGQKCRIINGINDLTDDMFKMIKDIIENGYIDEIRKVNESFMKNDKGMINLLTGRNAASNTIKELVNLIYLKLPKLGDSIKFMETKNRNDNYEYHTIIREKL